MLADLAKAKSVREEGENRACGAPLDGVISGRALYDGRLDPAEAAAHLAG